MFHKRSVKKNKAFFSLFLSEEGPTLEALNYAIIYSHLSHLQSVKGKYLQSRSSRNSIIVLVTLTRDTNLSVRVCVAVNLAELSLFW